MPPYLTHKSNTYYFRQAVPVELRLILGKREIKKSLGTDFSKAVRACKRFAVEADNMLADAREKLDSIPVAPYSRQGIQRTRHVPINEITPDFERLFANLTKSALLETDQEKRIAGLNGAEFDDYSAEISAMVNQLRKQLAMGNVTPMIPSSQMFLVGRGYDPSALNDADWRRLAYLTTQATLEAYEAIEQRQLGRVVPQPTEATLPSQFEIQNQRQSIQPVASVSWQNLYDVWANECERRQNTKDSYLAAMKLFITFCKSLPQHVTREDALAYRDYLLQIKKLAAGTVSNKIGFVGTLINSGRNNSQYAKYLAHNPFADIKIKQSKRGKAGERRLPFNDDELKTIFSSYIFDPGHHHHSISAAAAWMASLAYLTGMRLEEIALLHKRQFHVDAKGNHYIHTEDGKNENSTDRDVPIHPMLLDAGLLDFVTACAGRLFPKVKCTNEIQSKAFSQWFGRYLTRIGITAKSKVFHSFRHLFKDLCRNAGLDDSAIDQICGHEPGTVGGRYGTGRRIDVLTELIKKIDIPVKLVKTQNPPAKPTQ